MNIVLEWYDDEVTASTGLLNQIFGDGALRRARLCGLTHIVA